MRSREFGWLLAKEFRELLASRAWWLLLLIVGPLVGNSFITAVDLYAEASGIAGGPSALAQGLSPLDGIFVPTLGAYDLAVTLLFPFVAIRVISAEKQSGAWKLMLQSPFSVPAMIGAKLLALLAGWAIAWMPGLFALVLWRFYGGAIFAPELLTLLLGHMLRVVLSAGVAFAAASLSSSAASAAIVTLGFTVGTWALDFVAMGRGGWLQKLAAFTPTAALRVFEQGQLRLNMVAVSLLIALAGFVCAAIWLTGREWRTRAGLSIAAAAILSIGLWVAAELRSSWDWSENRRNSFPPAAEAALRQIRRPLHVTVFLAPEDPRLMDLDRNILGKFQRVLPKVDIDYASRSRSGLFEGPGDHYGEVWYEIDGQKTMSRSTTEAIVLETVLQLAHVPQPSRGEQETAYNGHPLAARPTGAAWLYYLLWPLVVVAAGWIHLHKRS